MFERILAFFRNLFKRAESKVVTQPVTTPIPFVTTVSTEWQAPIRKAFEFLKTRSDPVSLYDLTLRVGYGLNAEEVEYARSLGVYVRPDAIPAGPPSDDSGPDISNGRKLYKLAEGQKQTVTFNRAGIVRVVGYAGTALQSVTDHLGERVLSGTVSPYDRQMDAGSYTFSVKPGGDVAVQLL